MPGGNPLADDRPDRPPPLGASARRLGATALELLRVRLELLEVEWAAEKARLGAAIFLGALAIGTAMVALAALGVLAVLLAGEGARLVVLAAVVAAYAVLAGLALWWARRVLLPHDGALADSLAEIDRDVAALRGESP